MQYRVYDRQTLKYKDGGYVQSYTIDDDYIVNNNSTVSVVKKRDNTLSDVTAGDVIALIENSGAYHKGVITTVDATSRTISYKGDKELFNDTVLNAFITKFVDNEDLSSAGRFGLNIVVAVLKEWFVTGKDGVIDPCKALPITFVINGDVLDENGNPKMLWSWKNDSIKLVDWLTELFTTYNVSLSWVVDFDIAGGRPDERKPHYICTISAITNSGGIIKDNVAMQAITYTTKELPDATVCYVIDGETKEPINMSSGKNYLNPKAGTKDYYIYYHTGDSNLSASFILYKERENSKLSGYFRIRSSDVMPDKGFTYSQQSGDMLLRAIVAYDKDYNKIGYINYQPNSNGFFSIAFDYNSFTMHNATTEEEIENKRKQIKYFAIDYCAQAEHPQLEKGNKATSFDPFDIPSTFYLYEKDGKYSISVNMKETGKNRVLPVRSIIATYNANNTDTSDMLTPESVAKEKLMPSEFNQAIQIRINGDSKMFDFEIAKFGDGYKIINEQGTIDSVYTGRKSTSGDKWVTLYFGLGRQNYTDLMQIKLRKQNYTEIYNQG